MSRAQESYGTDFVILTVSGKFVAWWTSDWVLQMKNAMAPRQ